MTEPVIRLSGLEAGYGSRRLLGPLDLDVAPGELIAVLGPNGSGKSTLLKVLLGLLAPQAGSVEVTGKAPKEARAEIGYVPQHRDFDRDLPVRGRELVGLGLSGQRLGLPWARRAERAQVEAALVAVGAELYAEAPVGMLSGGEQQRLRVAQALLGEPALLLCDEPLLALDLMRQAQVISLIEAQRRRGAAVLFVTHEINPVLPYVDRILYLVAGRIAIGEPDEVLTTERLSALYGTQVEVLRLGERIIVAAGDDGGASSLLGHHHDHDHEDVVWD